MCRIPTSASSGAFVKCLVEGLFAYFFSEHRIPYKEEDCREFLALANRRTGFTTVTDGDCEWNDCLCSCSSLNVFKLYLITILGKAETGTILGLHDPMVCYDILDALVAFTKADALTLYSIEAQGCWRGHLCIRA